MFQRQTPAALRGGQSVRIDNRRASTRPAACRDAVGGQSGWCRAMRARYKAPSGHNPRAARRSAQLTSVRSAGYSPFSVQHPLCLVDENCQRHSASAALYGKQLSTGFYLIKIKLFFVRLPCRIRLARFLPDRSAFLSGTSPRLPQSPVP